MAEVKLTHFSEIANLSNSRADRIAALESALARFKMAIAQGMGDRELVSWFAENWVETEEVGGGEDGTTTTTTDGENVQQKKKTQSLHKGNPFTLWKAKVK
jgi:hypothetical protein